MSTLKTVLIAGATGFLGAKITDAFLAKKEFEVLVLARKPSPKTDEFKSKGAKIVEGDLSDVESLKKATQGVDVVVSVVGKEALGLQPNLIEASAYSKVKRIIPSEFGNDTEAMPKGQTVPWDLKKAAQEQIHKLGLDYTFIINNPFMDNLLSPFAGVNVKDQSINLYGDAVMTAIHTDDIAKLVPEIVLNPNTKNKTVKLGAETFKWNDVVAQLEKLTGTEWKKNSPTIESLEQQIQATDNALLKFSLGAQKFILKTNGAALSPLDNLTDPFYAHIKPISVNEFLAQLVQQNK